MKKNTALAGLALVFGLAFAGCPTDSPQPTVTGVTVGPATANVARGGSRGVTATVSGTNGHPTTVVWTVEGGTSGTSISVDGYLEVLHNV